VIGGSGQASRRRRWRLALLLAVAGAAAAAAGAGTGPQPDGARPGPVAGSAPAARPATASGAASDAPSGVDTRPGPGNVASLALRHSAEGLRKTYLDRQGRRKDGMHLPRIIVFNGEGRLLGGQAGFRTGDMRHLRRLVHDNRPFPRAADLEDTLAELETPDGAPVLPSDLPAADVVLVVYRSAGCPRCDRLDAELAVVVAGLHRHRFAWLVVDSDPGRVDASGPAASH
jgi:hypothetical protein